MRPTCETPRPAGGRGRDVEVTLTILGMVVVCVAMLLAARDVVASQESSLAARVLVLALSAALTSGALVHLMTRIGHIRRLQGHRPAARDELDRRYDAPAPAVTVLVPSYREEPGVIRQTLLSAALQEYPDRRVVLLIDDPPAPAGSDGRQLLDAARALPDQIDALLREPRARLTRAAEAFHRRRQHALDLVAETRILAELHAEVAGWLRARAAVERVDGHVDAFFVEQVLSAPAREHEAESAGLRDRIRRGEPLDGSDVQRRFQRLAALFRVEVTSFERKGYANLSHAPNKAMNLNSYLSLLGRTLRTEQSADGTRLVDAGPLEADVAIPDADYVVTLDADSLLLPGYVLRLVTEMERPGSARVAVMQTPYCAVPGAPGLLEQVAGATTDVMHVIHQGSTSYGATFWVGANALLRRIALEDIATVSEEQGEPVVRYIQDRTVIEDTESSIDLLAQGWELVNYPERLAYSATPPDYGSLLIQRRRWANGGLLILPKFVVHYARTRGRLRRLPEAVVRAHYLGSIAAVNVALLGMLTFPLGDIPISPWLPVALLPYLLAYARDLRRTGHGARRLPQVWALNLVLLPVNLGGVAKSLSQAVTGRPTAFARTPKVTGRTAAPALYPFATIALLCSLIVVATAEALVDRWVQAVCVGLNAGLLAYGITVFMPWRFALADIRGGLTRRPARSTEPAPTAVAPAPAHGDTGHGDRSGDLAGSR